MKLKAKGNNEAVIEKFNAQSSKTAKYAKSVIKKREPSELKHGQQSNTAASNIDTSSLQNGVNITVTAQD